MILGSHNSFSFAKPQQWWLRPFTFTARCQSKNIEEQIKLGVSYFDLRVRWHKNTWRISHGIMDWDISIDEALSTINDYYRPLDVVLYNKFFIVRVILEQNKKLKNQEVIDDMFIQFCEELQIKYKHIYFVGGNRKYDWEKLYTFEYKDDADARITINDKIYNISSEPELKDVYSSTTNPFGKRTNTILDKIDDWWPWLYAKFHNKKAFKSQLDNQILFLDFIEIGNPLTSKNHELLQNEQNDTLDKIGKELYNG